MGVIKLLNESEDELTPDEDLAVSFFWKMKTKKIANPGKKLDYATGLLKRE